jgi:hypothetical protein
VKRNWILGLLLVFLLITACTSASPASTQIKTNETPATNALDGKTLVQERCTICHNVNRITSQKNTADGWKMIVENMVGRGAMLNAQEQQVVIDYLATTYAR